MSDEVKSAEKDKPSITLPGTVEKIIPAVGPIPEKAQISVETAEDLYKEIRVENALKDANGNPVALKKGAEVEVTIKADSKTTVPMKQNGSSN
jgi:hypothetical protein